MREITAPKPPSFAALVQQFFTEYLVAHCRLGKAPTQMRLVDLTPDLILAFGVCQDRWPFFHAVESSDLSCVSAG